MALFSRLRFRSLRAAIFAALSLLSFLLLLHLGHEIVEAVQKMAEANRLTRLNRFSNAVLDASQNFILERGRSRIAMSAVLSARSGQAEGGSAPDAAIEKVRELHRQALALRDKGDKALAQMDAFMAQYPQPHLAETWQRLQETRQEVLSLRGQVDRLLGGSDSSEDPLLIFPRHAGAINRLVVSCRELVAQLAVDFSSDSQLTQLNHMKLYSLELSDAFGRLSALVGTMVARRNQMEQELFSQVVEHRQRLDLLWEHLREEAQFSGDDRFPKMVEEVYQVYAADFTPLVNQVQEEAYLGVFTLSPMEYTKVSGPIHQSLLAVMRSSTSVTDEAIDRLWRESRLQLMYTTAGALTVLLLVAFVWFFVGVRVTGPIGRLISIMNRLARWDTSVEIPQNETSRELADMAAALEIFRGNGRELLAAKDAAERSARESEALEGLLRLSLQAHALHDFLRHSLDLLLESVPWLRLLPQGALFLTDEQGKGQWLRLAVSKNLSTRQLGQCEGVAFGYCLCGRAAATREIQIATGVEAHHDIRCEGMDEHGHFVVPILEGERVLGVLTLYVSGQHVIQGFEEGYLRQVADVLGMGISLRYSRFALEEARDKAQAADRAKSNFLANMSHEIRTPMNAVIGLTQLALKTELTEKQYRYLRDIEKSADSLLVIINDILDFSKIEAGQLRMESTTFPLDRMLENVATVVARRAQEKGLEFLIAVDPMVPHTLVGDPLRLGQVLINLVNNGIKFTEHGEVLVSIEAGARQGETISLAFSVSDTGIGMSPEQVGRLFRPFSQADESTTRKYGGTGLGLSISKNLVELMGGSMEVKSVPGAGSTFRCTIPFGVPAEDETVFAGEQLTGLKTLVVDDNEHAREIMAAMAESLSWRAHTAESCQEALAKLVDAQQEGEPFRLVLMDWMMPQIDGIEASRRIKASKDLSQAPWVVMVTAYGREEVREQARQAGVDGFLYKPINASMLLESVQFLSGEATGRGLDWRRPAVAGSACLAGMRILLAEDNQINQRVAVALLESAGAQVVVVDNGKEALDILLREGDGAFVAVLMDIQMPEMDGYEATRAIRAMPEFCSLPIIGLTAHAMAAERQRCLDVGMNDHVAKPISQNLLFASLLRWVKVKEDDGRAWTGAVVSDAVTWGGTPPVIPGFDTRQGLERVAGDGELYQRLLGMFAESQVDAGVQVREALARRDHAMARQLLHASKGVAGNLGATQVFAAAVELEQALEEGKDTAMACAFARFETALGHALAGIAGVIGQEARRANSLEPPTALPPARLAELLRELHALVLASDPTAEDFILRHRDALAASLPGDLFVRLDSAVSSYSFDEALALLDRQLAEPA
ncbi:MAG: response regulator [Thermodesulfobacteriota bacterium]